MRDTTGGSSPRARPGRAGRRAARQASGRFLVRLDPALHEALRSAARQAGTSLNEHVARTLAAPATAVDNGDAAAIVRRALSLFRNEVLGVVVFGSWARGQAGTASDIDVLIVIDPHLPLSRDLYRRWDEVSVTWDGHAVEPHFVHLPDPERVTGGVWAEAAIDGVVIFERRLAVSRALIRVRHHILSGRLVRRLVHGQPYWAAEVA